MTKDELIKNYKDNGILIDEIDSAVYNIIFDKKYTEIIKYNVATFGLDTIIISAKNRAVMGGQTTNFINDPNVTMLSSSPYEFQVNGPFIVAVGFAQRIIT
ncbi:hypothetical protein [Bacillus sp. RS11]|uniref:hypothetical protein n=1 Tax=Lysinibacillus sp. RS11 TaxID=3242682 RepID=UPI0035C6EABC